MSQSYAVASERRDKPKFGLVGTQGLSYLASNFFSDTIVSSEEISTLESTETLYLGPHEGSYETSLAIFKDGNFTIPATSEDPFLAPKKIYALAEFQTETSFKIQLKRCWATPR